MKLEIKERGLKEYYDEFLYVASKYKSFLKNPIRKAYSSVKMLYFSIAYIFLAIFLITYFYIMDKNYLYVFFLGILLILLLFSIFYTIFVKKRIKAFMSEKGTKYISFDEHKVEYQDNDKKVKIDYNDIAYIIINKYSICFLPKKSSKILISISTDYKEKVIECLIKYDKINLLVDNSTLYKQKNQKR